MFPAGQECAAHGPTQASGTVLPYIWLVQRLVKRLSFANSARSSWRFARWYFYLLHSTMWQKKKKINSGVDFVFYAFFYSYFISLASVVLDRLKLLLSAYTQRVKTGNCRWNSGCLLFLFWLLFNGNEAVKWPMKHIHKLDTPLVYLNPGTQCEEQLFVKIKWERRKYMVNSETIAVWNLKKNDKIK